MRGYGLLAYFGLQKKKKTSFQHHNPSRKHEQSRCAWTEEHTPQDPPQLKYTKPQQISGSDRARKDPMQCESKQSIPVEQFYLPLLSSSSYFPATFLTEHHTQPGRAWGDEKEGGTAGEKVEGSEAMGMEGGMGLRSNETVGLLIDEMREARRLW